MLDPITAKRNLERPAVRRGCGCTWSEHMQAREEAEALVKRLGHGWQPRIWENGGWHYEAIRGVCEVKPSRTRRGGELWTVDGYTAWIQTRPQYISGIQRTPEEALREAMLMMKAAFDQLRASFNENIKIGLDMGLIEQPN